MTLLNEGEIEKLKETHPLKGISRFGFLTIGIFIIFIGFILLFIQFDFGISIDDVNISIVIFINLMKFIKQFFVFKISLIFILSNLLNNMSEQTAILVYIKNMLADLIYINGIIATELIKVTENTATIRRGEEFLKKTTCIAEHDQLNQKVIDILIKYQKRPGDLAGLDDHVLKNHNK